MVPHLLRAFWEKTPCPSITSIMSSKRTMPFSIKLQVKLAYPMSLTAFWAWPDPGTLQQVSKMALWWCTTSKIRAWSLTTFSDSTSQTLPNRAQWPSEVTTLLRSRQEPSLTTSLSWTPSTGCFSFQDSVWAPPTLSMTIQPRPFLSLAWTRPS